MSSKCNNTDSCSTSTNFSMREITGRWVSLEGSPSIIIYRNTSLKWERYHLSLAYNNPHIECDCKVYKSCGTHYIELYERIEITYDQEEEVLNLFAFGNYVRGEEITTY